MNLGFFAYYAAMPRAPMLATSWIVNSAWILLLGGVDPDTEWRAHIRVFAAWAAWEEMERRGLTMQ